MPAGAGTAEVLVFPEPSDRGGAVALRLLDVERDRIGRGEPRPLGLRAVARRAS